jgi:selenocysteine-specific elongation factor
VLAGARPIRHGMRVRFHQGTVEVIGRVAVIGPAAESGQAAIAPGARAFVRLRLERPAVLTRGDRYILRAYSPPVTIAGGEILDPQPPRLRVRSPAALDRVRALDSAPSTPNGGAAHIAELLIAEAGLSGFPTSALVSRVGLSPEHARSAMHELLTAGRAVQAGEVLAGSAALNDARRAAVAAIEAHHRQHPTSEGMPREELRTRVFPRINPDVFDRVVDELARSGTVAGRDRIRLATHQVALSPADQRACDAVERVLREAGLRPPDLAALAQAAGVSAGALTPLLQLLQRQRRVIKVEGLVFDPQALDSLKEAVSAMKAGERGNATIDVATFKDRFGVTRKFAIPLLEYLDRERVTRRVGETRTIL